MSDEYLDAVAQLFSSDEAASASMPPPVAQLVFLALPADARGRACCVCRAWRDALADPSLWTRLDMSFLPAFKGSYGAEERRFFAMMRGAAGRARGELCQLVISQHYVELHELLPVLTAYASSLRELHLCYVSTDELENTIVEQVLAALPLLQVLTVENVECKWEDAPRVLRAVPPFAPLQIRGSLFVDFQGEDGSVGGMTRFGPFVDALADAVLQPALLRLYISTADLAQPALMGALVDAVLARRLRELALQSCTPPAAASLARLLAEGSLAVLRISFARPETGTPLFDAAGAALVADALRMNTTLLTLELSCTGLCVDMRAACALLGGLVGHSSLRVIRIAQETIDTDEDRSSFGAALAVLVAANAPSLHALDCSTNLIGDAGMAPIVEALALNHHLRELDVEYNHMSEEFACDELLPAVRANKTLRVLKSDEAAPVEAAWEAVKLVRRRGQDG